MITFTVMGTPIGKGRPRVVRRGNLPYPVAITPEKTKNAERSFLSQALPYKPVEPLQGPLGMKVIATFSRPKHHYRTGKNSHLLKDDAPIYHTAKPDASNIQKLIEDAMNGVFYADDSQVANMQLIKIYGDIAKMEVSIWVI